MTCKVIVGGFYGDEGKGKIIAYLSIKDKPKIVCKRGSWSKCWPHLRLQ